MSQITELKLLISIAKHPKNREVLQVALMAAITEDKKQKEIARCLARQARRTKRRAERFSMLSARHCKRVKTNDLRAEWGYAQWDSSRQLRGDKEAVEFFHWAQCDRKFWDV